MRLVYTHENKLILHSAKNVLELNGIKCFLKNEHSVSAAGNLGITNTDAELWISDIGDYENAVSLLEKEIANSSSKAPWICDKCNEENDGRFELCWNCRNELLAS